jgi:hypothetical protein
MGAQSRLLPYHIPMRFFFAAALFQVLAWALLAAASGEATSFIGGSGLPLAALHAMTLGVLAMTVIGASLQLLSVATGVALDSLFPCRLASWLFIPGTAILVAGMAAGDHLGMALGGLLAIAGLAAWSIVLIEILRRAPGLRVTVRHCWWALAALALLAAIGAVLIIDLEHGVLGGELPGHGQLAALHAILGGFGFIGLLAMGFSYILVPMFALSAAPDEKAANTALGLVLGAIALGIAGALTDQSGSTATLLAAAAALLGLIGAALYIRLMLGALRSGMKKRLGLSFVLVRAAWALLPLAVLLGGLAGAGIDGWNMPTLFGFVLIFGWLLTFVGGILQRVLPFLTSMHAHNLGQRPPRLSEMGRQKITLPLHAACHASGLVLVAAGIAFDQSALVSAGGAVGTIGALSFLWFAVEIVRLNRRTHADAQINDAN